MNKKEILSTLEESRKNFLKTLEGLPEEAMLQPGAAGEWSVKDILAHLSLWEAELIKMLFQIRQGEKPTSAQFSSKKVDAINAEWQAANASRPLERVMADFLAVRKQTIRQVQGFADQDLTDPERYPWLRGKPLSTWIATDSFEHEGEHSEDIRQWRARTGLS